MRAGLVRPPVLEIALIVLALAALVVMAVLNERRSQTVETDSYSSYDAATGGYRAFYELLQREGVRVERFQQRPGSLDAAVDTLVYAEPLDFDVRQIPATMNDAHALEAWVREGGRLVYFGHDDAAAKQKLLAFPFSRLASSRRHPSRIAPELQAAGVAQLGDAPTPERWKLPQAQKRVLFDDGRGAVIVAYPFGRGAVTAIVDETLLDNANLARGDRARLAFALAAPRQAGGLVFFDETIHGYLTPEHWWSIVPRPFLYALAVAGFALLVALFGAAVRLGPPLLPEPRDDRSSADFIEALAALLERGNAFGTAMRDAADSTSHSIARSLGASNDASDEEIAAGLDRQDERTAFRTLMGLAEHGPANPENLVRAVALAQHLRKEFAPHARQRY
jgi:hypothetical protein